MYKHLASSKRHLKEGSVLNDKYIIERILGEGGFSITYLAKHIDMQNRIAIKELYFKEYMYRDTDYSNNVNLISNSDKKRLSKDLNNFLSEARVLSELARLNGVVKVLDFFHENNTAYIVMEYVEGISLFEEVNRNGLYSWDTITEKMLPLIKSLSVLHDKGLIHRDIKPENIILSDDDSFTLIDFGAAIDFTSDKTHSIYYSEGYAPKEQYLRTGKFGPYSDVYALCAVIYYCITGHPPALSVQRAVYDELKRPSEINSKIDKRFEQILLKGLHVNPESRWQTMGDLYDALLEVLPENRNKKKYRAAPVFITLVSLISFFCIAAILFLNRDIILSQRELKGDTFSFVLEAPLDMTAQDFKTASNIIQKRARIFVGSNNYRIRAEEDRISISIPESVVPDAEKDNELDSSEDINSDTWTKHEIADILFSSKGQWRISNPDYSSILITSENFKNLELKYGSLPVVSTSGDRSLFSETIDWTSEEIYYLKFQFDEDTESFLKDYLNQEGYIMMSIPHLENSDCIYGFGWISKGDGKTAYFPIGDKDSKCENIADTLFYIMSTDPISDSLAVIMEDPSSIKWEESDPDYPMQCNVESFNTETVEIIADPVSNENWEKIFQFCKEQLSLLNTPFAIGWENHDGNTQMHIRLSSNNLTELVLNATAGASFHLVNSQGSEIELLNYFDKVNADYDQNLLHLFVTDDFFNSFSLNENDLNIKKEDIYLYLDLIRIGQLVEINYSEKELTFRILLPQKTSSFSAPDNKTMTKFIANAMSFQEICHGMVYSYKRIWRASDNSIISRQKEPLLHVGTDEERFDTLKTIVEKMGGNLTFCIEHNAENLSIEFKNWNGRFPEDALKTVETIYREGKFSDGLSSRITFNLDAWAGGAPANLNVCFEPGQSSKSSLYAYGIVTASEESTLQTAKKYVEKSAVLTPSEGHSKNNLDTYDNSIEWEYIYETAHKRIISK